MTDVPIKTQNDNKDLLLRVYNYITISKSISVDIGSTGLISDFYLQKKQFFQKQAVLVRMGPVRSH